MIKNGNNNSFVLEMHTFHEDFKLYKDNYAGVFTDLDCELVF